MIKSVGFLIPTKENEKRRVLTPIGVEKVKNKNQLYFQESYGKVLGISDEAYEKAGAHICTLNETLQKDIICCPKIGESEHVFNLKDKILFGWLHKDADKNLRKTIRENNLTCYAWEDMNKNGRHIFWKNNVLAGEASILNAFSYYGKTPYGLKVAILGRGNVAQGAVKILNQLGANTVFYSYKKEKLFKLDMNQYDIIVNAYLWDKTRTDYLITKKDLKKLKRGCFIIDVSCDKQGAIESTHPSTISKPTYWVNGILHYSVDHSPSILYKTATESIEKAILPYFDDLMENRPNEVLESVKIN